MVSNRPDVTNTNEWSAFTVKGQMMAKREKKNTVSEHVCGNPSVYLADSGKT